MGMGGEGRPGEVIGGEARGGEVRGSQQEAEEGRAMEGVLGETRGGGARGREGRPGKRSVSGLGCFHSPRPGEGVCKVGGSGKARIRLGGVWEARAGWPGEGREREGEQ